MNQKSDIEKKVEEVLNSLDGIKRATPQPWLFSRIKARLNREEDEEKTVWGNLGSFLSKPGVAIAGGLAPNQARLILTASRAEFYKL